MLNGFVLGDRGLGASGDTHPLWVLGHALADPYLVVGASAVGQIHLSRGLPRDDAFMVRSLGPWLAIAVADGVGSRPLSRYGATYAVEALTSLLLRPFAVPLNELRDSQSARSAFPADASLAPPAGMEEVELKLPVDEKELGEGRAPIIDMGLDLLKKLMGSAPSPADQPVSPPLAQVASVGWWLPVQVPVSQPIPPVLPPAPARRPPWMPSVKNAAAAPPSKRITAPLTPDVTDLGGVMNQAFEKTHLGLRSHAQALGVDLADLGCTALALLLNRETGHCAVGQVGDGAILGLTARGEVRELADAPSTEDPQSTYTLNRPNFQKYLAVQVLQPAPANPFVTFYLMTDGLSGDLLFSAQQAALSTWAQAVQQNLTQAVSPAQAAAGMLNWLASYQVKGSWDDRTLVVITQREQQDDNCHPTGGQPGPTQSTDNQ